jgi:hypothetical protein
MTEIEKMGYSFTKGVFRFLMAFMASWLVVVLLIAFFTPVDDCDKDWWNRCGFKVHTDNKTGKQYLVTSGGGIIERATK